MVGLGEDGRKAQDGPKLLLRAQCWGLEWGLGTGVGTGDWGGDCGVGIGDWELGTGDWGVESRCRGGGSVMRRRLSDDNVGFDTFHSSGLSFLCPA